MVDILTGQIEDREPTPEERRVTREEREIKVTLAYFLI